MKKIAIIILALVALAFGECRVGDLRYCHVVWDGSPGEKYVSYGGPESKIREMLNDPCDGAKITTFAFSYRQSKSGREGDSFILYCGEWKKYHITPDSLELLQRNNTRDAIDYGNKAMLAWESASRVAKFIKEYSGKIGWNP